MNYESYLFDDTDTLLVYFNNNEIVETKDLNQNTIVELDQNGNIVSTAIEHAKEQTEVYSFSFNKVGSQLVVLLPPEPEGRTQCH